MRFELNDLGIKNLVTETHHLNKKRSTAGEIIGESNDKRCWVIKWDNRKTPDTLAKSLVTVINPTDTGSVT